MATAKCSFACFTENSPSLLEYDSKLEAAELKTYLLGEWTMIETFEKKCPECDKAIDLAQLEVVRVILRCCPRLILLRDVLGQTALMSSVISDAVSLTKALLVYKDGKEQWLNKQLKSVDPDFRTALHHAAAEGKIRQAALLLEFGASVRGQDSYGATPMHYAAIRGFCSTLRLLYKANKYTDEVRTNNGHSAFMWAAMNGIDISIRTMINANPVVNPDDCDSQGCTALHLAAAGDHVEVINTLLLFKWNAEKRNKLGETPLLVAAKNGSAKAVRRFLHVGVDHSSQDKFKNTALHVAADSDGKKETLRQLLYYLKDSSLLNMRNDMGQTPLHCATEYNAVQCVRYLLKCGADPLIRDYRGWDPLMVAIQQGCWSTIILMLKNSSNINCYSIADNQTTLSLALEKKNYILASFLEKNGALLANEIQDTAARIIQCWYRARSVSRRH
ncbi:inversin [Loa loa]|uniref:Inversin n=1 Tax=Loa loa TaxID=7209 RepID=A0A1S0TMJ5_LOALO|nr:inversin [Loa loa]EFO16786.2 inversin [Loa loa]